MGNGDPVIQGELDTATSKTTVRTPGRLQEDRHARQVEAHRIGRLLQGFPSFPLATLSRR
jgi:hypothetical protein